MTVLHKKTISFTLTLNEEEANWLRQQMQNPLHGTALEEEEEIDRKMRGELWEALKPEQ